MRSRVPTPGSAVPLPRNSNSGQVVHTQAHLLWSTGSWYWPKVGHVLQVNTVTADVAAETNGSLSSAV